MEQKIIVVTCVHGRRATVKHCFDKMPTLHKVVVYSDDSDAKFLNRKDVILKRKFSNSPLSKKWAASILALEDIDFDAVILLGSDDYCDQAFIDFALKHIDKYDMIAFEDIYFEEKGKFYYWSGYTCKRQGEPIGAGKIYSRKFLERIGFNLFPSINDAGLDGISWNVCKRNNAKMLITTLKENNLFLCDVKDGEGITSFKKIQAIYKMKPCEIN